jgi:hypothetical protein
MNATYAMPLKIYQRRDVEISSEEAFPDDKRRSPPGGFDHRVLTHTTITVKDSSLRTGSRDEETGSERSAGGVVKAHYGV